MEESLQPVNEAWVSRLAGAPLFELLDEGADFSAGDAVQVKLVLQDGQVVLLAQGPWFKVTFAETSILQCMAQFMTERMVEAGEQDGVGWCRHALMTFAVSAHCVQERVHATRKGLVTLFAGRRAPHPELAPRLERLRAAQEAREYAAMMGDVHGHNNDGSVDIEMSSYKSQMGIGLNLVVSMGTMYTVGHYAGGTAEEPNGPRAVLFGLVLCIGTMLIEVTLYIIGASRMEAKAQLRAEAAANGHGSDLARVQKEYVASRIRTGGGRWG